MKETVFFLEGRAGNYFYHFFIYNLGGLYYILNKNYNNRGPTNTSVLLENTNNIVSKPSAEISFPIKIYMKDILPFQREAFEILKDKFELIEDVTNIEDYEIVSIYGEISLGGYSDNGKNIYPFIRRLFLDNLNYQIIPKKRIFITRKGSHIYHNNILKRIILNEEELNRNILQKYNFEYVQLEDYNMHDKIKIFMESEVIVSSNSGALTLLLFANINTRIIEIRNNGTTGFSHEHYSEISSELGLNYNRFSDINEDHNGNFNINIKRFEDFLVKLL